jgi:hypothetical protein
MANAAAKKAAKVGDVTSKRYLPYIIFSSLLYVGVRLVWGYQTSTSWHYIYFVIFTILHGICQYGLIQSAKDNLQGEMYFDAFCVNLLSEIVSAFTNWGRVILLLIPGYFLYLGINWYLSRPKKAPEPIPESTEKTSTSQTDKKSGRAARTARR